jgi:DNA-binding HxlR family transcriptional regulator
MIIFFVSDTKLLIFTILFIVLYQSIALYFWKVTQKQKIMVSKVKENERTHETCTKALIPVRDALDILSGKWKLPIILALQFGNRRFSELAKQVHGITDKMLSKELRELEMNELVKRTVYDSVPVVVEYSMTPYGETLEKLIEELQAWGIQHRKRIIRKGK